MRIKRKPNLHLRKIVLEETNDGRDIVRFLKNVIVHIEGGPQTFGIRPQDFARNHKIAAARILAKLGFEEGEYYLGRTYVQTPFRRIHSEEDDIPRPETTRATRDLYRLVRKKTNDGADIMLHFIEIMKGYHPEFKPHLRMAAAKELVRQIEFDYEEEPAPPAPTRSEPAAAPVGASLLGAHNPQPEPATPSESNPDPEPSNPVHPTNPVNPASDKETNANQPNPVHPTNPINPASDKETNPNQPNPVHPINPINPASDKETNPNPRPTNPVNPDSDKNHISFRDFLRKLHIEDGSAPYRDYAAQHARESESIYESIIRRAAYSYHLQEAENKAQDLIVEFDDFMAERDPGYRPIAVPDQLITKSLTERMDETRLYPYDPSDYYDLDDDYFYYCLCRYCERCDEVNYHFQFMRELEEEYEDP